MSWYMPWELNDFRKGRFYKEVEQAVLEEIVPKLLAEGVPPEKIATALGRSEREVRSLATPED